MRNQRGYTLVEMMVVVAVIALASGFASMAGSSLFQSARISRVTSQLADSVSVARERAIARHEQWRIRFVTNPVPGSQVVHGYVLESCPVVAGTNTCGGPWTQQGDPVSVYPGLGIQIDPTHGWELLFERTGYFRYDQTEVLEMRICRITRGAGGGEVCQPGSTGRLVRIRKFSGIIET